MKRKEQGKENKSNLEKNSKKSKNKFIALGIVAGIAAVIAVVVYTLDNTSSSSTSMIDGIECDTVEYGVFHIHAHLDVYVGGSPYTVPAYIGIKDNTCLYWLHTHDASGVIHIESPKSRDFTAGEFFDIWNSTGSNMPPSGTPTIYVNGQVVNTALDKTMLHAHDEIAVVYGTKPNFIPQLYQFPEGE